MAYPLKPGLLRPQRAETESKEQLEAALSGLNTTDDTTMDTTTRTDSNMGWVSTVCCVSTSNSGPVTESSKRRQLVKMVLLILSPIVILLPVSLYFIADNIKQKTESDGVRNTVLFSTELGRLVHIIQKERDMSVLYLSAIGPETKSFLNIRYLDSDEALSGLTDWPVNIDLQKRDYFLSKRALQRYLTSHRNDLSSADTIYKEVNFYSDITGVLLRWMYDAITESKFGIIWKVLVAYQKVVMAKEQLSVERGLGTAYFSQGRFQADQVYVLYNNRYHSYKANIAAAMKFAPFLSKELRNDFDQLRNIQEGGSSNTTRKVTLLRNLIQSRSIDEPSLYNATLYYDSMSVLIDQHLIIQRAIADKILGYLDQRSTEMTTGVTVSSLVVIIVLIMCPILIRLVQRLTDNIQSFVLTLADKTKELNQEKKRTDSLLYQMLPKPVAEQLKRRRDVTAEFYKEVTVFFSDIVGFTRLTGECSPMEVVDMLNDIYTLFDQRIELYDVYKVETIGDSYMVASGVPNRNGNRHASEIANLSLDLLSTCAEVDMPLMPGRRLRLRIGMHSGQCVAGVVGLKLPRYCLFGDTINTASRMETNGLPNRIHCSASSYKLLNRTGSYVFQSRGNIPIKGKGMMATYFLLGRSVSPVHRVSETDSMKSKKKRSSTTAPDTTFGTLETEHEEKPPARRSTQALPPKAKDIPVKSIEENTEKDEKNNHENDPNQDKEEHHDKHDPITDGAVAGTSHQSVASFPPPSYQDLELEHMAHEGEYPPIFKVVEGYHF